MKTIWVAIQNTGKFETKHQFKNKWNFALFLIIMLFLFTSCEKNQIWKLLKMKSQWISIQ